MNVTLNVTLVAVGLLLAIQGTRGFRKGMTKEIDSLIAWGVTLFVLSLVVMVVRSFRADEKITTALSVIILIVVGLVYGVVRIFFQSIKMLSRLPVLHFLDQLLGCAVGLAEGILIVWLVFVLNEGGFLGEYGTLIYQDIAASRILSALYEYNYLIRLATFISG